jgi:hypothetical protein
VFVGRIRSAGLFYLLQMGPLPWLLFTGFGTVLVRYVVMQWGLRCARTSAQSDTSVWSLLCCVMCLSRLLPYAWLRNRPPHAPLEFPPSLNASCLGAHCQSI